MKKFFYSIIFLFVAVMKSNAGEIILKAEKSMLYFAGLYPSYLLYLKGNIPLDTKDDWVEKDYWAVLEVDKRSQNHGGEAVILKLKKTSKASPQPEWCVTEGGKKFDGKGPACLKTNKPKSMNQLRFKVKVQYTDTKDKLPKKFQNLNFVQYEVGYDEDGVSLSKLPGRLPPPNHIFGPVELTIFK
tara:strand:+ start:60 stop:617 length:558 start_codon:yes stop_codon:yes gene_type:complete